MSTMTDPNIFSPIWDLERDEPPFHWRRAYLGRQSGSDKLGASLFEVAPGGETFPIHIHHANEEMMVVLVGTPTLVTPDGERVLEAGAVVACLAGREGAHGLRNDTDQPVRLIVVSTMLAPEINEFPETGEIWVRDYAPGQDPASGKLDVRFTP